jgi:hypothetical protein
VVEVSAIPATWSAPRNTLFVSKGRASTYIAPSWSWASVQGFVRLGFENPDNPSNRILLEVLDVKVDLVNERYPLGSVKGGRLDVKGALAKEGLKIEYDSLILKGNDENKGKVYLDDHGLDTAEAALYYLSVILEQNNICVGDSLRGVILQPRYPGTETEFVRVGQFSTFWAKMTKGFQELCREYALSRGIAGAEDQANLMGPTHEIRIY